jgi:hypothetical protein
MAHEERLRKLAQVMIEAAESNPDHAEGDRILISACFAGDSDSSGTMALAGYDDLDPNVLINDISQMLITAGEASGFKIALLPMQRPDTN